jgi:hypothetical protein
MYIITSMICTEGRMYIIPGRSGIICGTDGMVDSDISGTSGHVLPLPIRFRSSKVTSCT